MNADTAAGPTLQALAEASARLGADPLLIQAAGGNTSVKVDDTLWVKASGLWLRDALQRPLLAPVGLSQVRQRVAAGEADPVGPTLRTDLAPPGLRPSIETTLHALMPHPVVLHVHAVDAIAWAVLPDAADALRAPLAAFRWAWVDYVRPGLPLTRAVAALTAEREVDVLMLANHGLVVGGATVAEAEARLAAVGSALRRPQRRAPAPDLAGLQAVATAAGGWRLPAEARCHAVATDALNLRRAAAGVLYPDHVVFLGDQLCRAPEHVASDEALLLAFLATLPPGADRPPCVAVPGRGLLVRDDLGEAAEALLACWADVLQRLPALPEPVSLPPEEARALTDWEAEKFRQQQRR
ncbi:class II aldolase/adducin family protein [Sphaerotilus microaerophilus]|uniref:Aldolase n=1 Tax=Sphaerotilus microaerophilus TaxID=2914710 RepID=A0ABM7YTT2_9BURK|nr:class II aldolase/adducin family protein [Sphaerotilus sp. FB-5]BDI08070.1 aldolase [Sphaerotilus sp. FB-5]